MFTCQGNLLGIAGINFEYLFDYDTAVSKADEYEKNVRFIAKDIREKSFDGEDLSFALGVYSWLASNIRYDSIDGYDQYICSVFDEEKSVCAGYSKVFKYICDVADVPCLYVSGEAFLSDPSDVEPHAWNIVYIDGEAKYIDATWGDAGLCAELKWFDSDKEKFLYTNTGDRPELDEPVFR